ncbi:hypothetical protein ACOME3_003075 [Neoechinorhynchus agilis]
MRAISSLKAYALKYAKTFNALSVSSLKQLTICLVSLLNGMKIAKHSHVSSVSEFLENSGLSNANIGSLLEFCKSNRLYQKLRGFQSDDGVNDFLKSINFLTKLTYYAHSANAIQKSLIISSSSIRVLTSVVSGTDDSVEIEFRIISLDAVGEMKDIVNLCHAVILAGGTMQPFEEFTDFIFKRLTGNSRRIKTYSFGHVIPDYHVAVISTGKYTDGSSIDLRLSSRSINPTKTYRNLWNSIAAISGSVLGGCVVFLPSYNFLCEFQKHVIELKNVKTRTATYLLKCRSCK